jgi:hypothetical protein
MNIFFIWILTAAVAALTVACAPASSETEAAQQNAAAAQAPGQVPRTSEGKPDMTGVWTPAPGGGDGLAELEQLYNGAAQAQIQKLSDVDDPLLRCLPYGVPRAVVSSPWPFQIVQRPGMMVVLTEYYHSFRLIPTDGSPHSADIIPTYFGDSAGRWEGDTLVVDVAGFNDKTWLADARDKPNPTSRGVWLHSDAVHVLERWTMVDADTLQYQAVVTDPKVLTGPWTTPTRTLKRQPLKKIGEGMCFDTTDYDIARNAK